MVNARPEDFVSLYIDLPYVDLSKLKDGAKTPVPVTKLIRADNHRGFFYEG